MNRFTLSLLSALLAAGSLSAQSKGLTNTTKSKFAKLHSTNLQDVRWTGGFWGERFKVYEHDMIMGVWKTMNDPKTSHAYRNFQIASGAVQGDWNGGPPFFDGDFYKFFESIASVYAVNKNPQLDAMMDSIIVRIAGSQRNDGYLHTPAIIREKQTSKPAEFEDRLNFETYNIGHLITAGCIHYRVTGKESLLNVSKRAADYLYNFYKRSSPELARNAICPSHYMAVVELYRTTGDTKYLELSKSLIDIRGLMENGTDDNQDRVPFRQQMKAMGHAVRANYLYAGVADVYAETGEAQLMKNLRSIWDDVVHTKMYITGACGALYDGTSPDGTCYQPDSIQKVHQSYGRSFQLPNHTAHNESCANIGNMLWNWRMFNATGEARYMDIVEQVTYNSLLASISLDGLRFFYTNPLSISQEFPYTMRWNKRREEWIWVYCCPPNIARTLAQINGYIYSLGKDGVYVNLYADADLSTQLPNGKRVKLSQKSNYPWDGKASFVVEETFADTWSIALRIPGWADNNVTIRLNGQKLDLPTTAASYCRINRIWKKGDRVEIDLPMRPRMMTANPLVEESRGQVAVQYGPIVYCLEGVDVASDQRLHQLALNTESNLKPQMIDIDGWKIQSLQGTATFTPDTKTWRKRLYQEANNTPAKNVPIRLIPYFAWGNRDSCDMTVWIPYNNK